MDGWIERESSRLRIKACEYGLPLHMIAAWVRWIIHGQSGGHFLRAFVDNDLRRTLLRADDLSAKSLKETSLFLHWEAPSGCCGSPEKSKDWERSGGLVGVVEAGGTWEHDERAEDPYPYDSSESLGVEAPGVARRG